MKGATTANWRRDALCALPPADPRWWDDQLPGESAVEREWRHKRAISFCSLCPVAASCREDVVLGFDQGIRGGELLPEPRFDSPGSLVLRKCPDCGRMVRYGHLAKHRRAVHKVAS